MSMTVDQNGSNPPALNSGSITLPPTEPIDMTTLFTGKLSVVRPVGEDEHSVNRTTPDAHGMPLPVAASAHANRAAGDNPIAEWLGTLSPQSDNQLPDRPHRQYRRPTHD